MTLSIHIIGLGVAEQAELGRKAQLAIDSADLVIGSQRQLETLRGYLSVQSKTLVLPKLAELRERFDALQTSSTHTKVILLASGDPLYFGIGRWVAQNFSSANLSFYPAVSSIQAACHRLALSIQDTQVISLHGRPLSSIYRYLKPHQTLVILTDQHSHPQALAKACKEAGFIKAKISVCEKLGYSDEKVQRYTLSELLQKPADAFDPLHVSVIEAGEADTYLPSFPGIEDAHFITDSDAGKGLITKREVRLAILSLMQASINDVVWDIGAGCGSVAVELAFWQPKAKVFAIEHHSERLACLNANIERFGVVNQLQSVAGRAPQALAGLPAANKIFIGGSDGELPVLLEQVWAQLPKGGVLVASAVTEQTKAQLLSFVDQHQNSPSMSFETLQIAVSKGAVLANQLLYRPNLPVTLFKLVKSA